MALTPTFTSVPRIGVGAVSTANTNRDGTGTLVSIITGVSAGTKINEIVVVSTANPADSTLTLFIYDGSTNWYFDEIDLGDPAAGSSTLPPYRTSVTYSNLILPSASHILKAAITVALTAGQMNVFAFGGDLT